MFGANNFFMKKILIHSIVFSPDGVSTAYLYNDIALKFKDEGYTVSVLTTTPHYNIVKEELASQPLFSKLFGLYYVSNYNGIVVKHIPQKKFKSTILRMIGFAYWHFMSLLLGLFENKIDVILSPSPPLTIGLINILLGKIKGAKVIYNVQEIYPDLLIQEGGVHSKFIISVLKWVEKFVYNHTDAVVTIDQVFYDTIVERFKDKSKLHIIPNFVDTSIYKPVDACNVHYNRSIFPENNALKLMYAGNIGHAQDWVFLMEVAKNLRDENIEFYIIGEGVMRDFLLKEINGNKLNKVKLIPYQPRETMPELIAYSDLQFIFMSPHTDGHGFPSKIYTIMACAKPMIVSSGADTPIVNFLKGKDCAFCITDKDFKTKINTTVQTIINLNLTELIQKGENARKYISKEYSKEVVTNKYVELIINLLKN